MTTRLPARFLAVGGAATLALLVAGCGSSSQAPASPKHSSTSMPSGRSGGSAKSGKSGGSSMSQGKAVITIRDFKYQAPSSVPAGAMVTVKNEDSVAHTVTADVGNAFDVAIAPGRTATFKAPGKAGSYPFHCKYHSNMHGTLKVS